MIRWWRSRTPVTASASSGGRVMRTVPPVPWRGCAGSRAAADRPRCDTSPPGSRWASSRGPWSTRRPRPRRRRAHGVEPRLRASARMPWRPRPRSALAGVARNPRGCVLGSCVSPSCTRRSPVGATCSGASTSRARRAAPARCPATRAHATPRGRLRACPSPSPPRDHHYGATRRGILSGDATPRRALRRGAQVTPRTSCLRHPNANRRPSMWPSR